MYDAVIFSKIPFPVDFRSSDSRILESVNDAIDCCSPVESRDVRTWFFKKISKKEFSRALRMAFFSNLIFSVRLFSFLVLNSILLLLPFLLLLLLFISFFFSTRLCDDFLLHDSATTSQNRRAFMKFSEKSNKMYLSNVRQ